MPSEFLLFVVLVFSAVLNTGNSNSIILPPEPLGPEAPDCSSYGQLCHLAYNITDSEGYHILQSNQEICRCPNDQSCETHWLDRENSIIKGFKIAGQDMAVKMSYCTLNQPPRVCRKNEVAMTMRGRGAFIFEVEEDFQCRCYRPLYEHSSWREGAYTYIAYSCGKPRCNANRLPSNECAQMTYDGGPGQYRIEYNCRCLRNEECLASENLPTPLNPVVTTHCQMVYGPDRGFGDRRRRRSSKK